MIPSGLPTLWEVKHEHYISERKHNKVSRFLFWASIIQGALIPLELCMMGFEIYRFSQGCH